jgi:1,4-alpha-glucan branching enzyme
MNLLNITTHHWRNSSFALPVVRTAFRRESKNSRKISQNHAHRHSHRLQRVRLEFFHPQASGVNIAGSFNDWRPGSAWMIALGNGRWVKEIMLPPGRYEYCFVVDGHWLPDPRAGDSTPSLRGNHNSILIVPPPNGNGHSHRLGSRPPRLHAPQCGAATI